MGCFKKIVFIFSIIFMMPFLSFAGQPPSSFHPGSEHPKIKLLVLIIASDEHPAFVDLQQIWRLYMHNNPEQVEAYFIKGDPSLEYENALIGDTIYSKVQDSYQPGILEKTLLSMEFLLDRLYEFDYVLRTNLSSFYHFPHLLEFLNTLPKKNCYCARALLPNPNDLNRELGMIPFGWGAGFILSPDLVEALVYNKVEILERSSYIPDDVLIGEFLYRMQVNIIPQKYCLLSNRADWNKKKKALPKDVFHFRAKKDYFRRRKGDNYNDEVQILRELVEKFYHSH